MRQRKDKYVGGWSVNGGQTSGVDYKGTSKTALAGNMRRILKGNLSPRQSGSWWVGLIDAAPEAEPLLSGDIRRGKV